MLYTDYDHPPYRPPSEAGSLLLRVTRGCPWNQCTFCSMYKDTSFERRPLDEIFQDIETARRIYGAGPRTVFIGDSNSLVLSPETLAKILGHLYEHFPTTERVTSYARSRTLCKKSIDELRLIRQAGLTRLHVGLETGNPELLKEIKKGATPEQMVEGCLRAKEAGFEVSLYVLAGIGGEEKWQQHADGTAAVLNQVDPHFIRIRTYVPTPYSPLWDSVQNGSFQLASAETILREQRRLVEWLNVTSQYLSVLQTIDKALDDLQQDTRYREVLEQKRYLTRL